MTTFPFTTPALRVEQPLGRYYVVTLPADLLLQVALSDVMTATLNDDGLSYTLEGNQRVIKDERLTQIANYIDRGDSSFPNSIILAANLSPETGLSLDELAESEDEASAALPQPWQIEEGSDGCHRLTIPSAARLASIIDGQHRLFAFAKAKVKARRAMQLTCAVFLDLPRPFQAQLFAIINSTQKRVDKSLTYELFGYNISDEEESYWTPDKLAVFLTRKLGTDPKSALRRRIIVAPKRDPKLAQLTDSADWRVSTAVVVEGILRLISSNPKRDTNAMLTLASKTRSALESGARDRSPLREVFLRGNDTLLYTLVLNYVAACERLFWSKAKAHSFIRRTVGVQALFDILRLICKDAYELRDVSEAYFLARLRPASSLDFSEDLFRNASGSGRSVMRRAIETRLGLTRS